jgi:hypothetical protein
MATSGTTAFAPDIGEICEEAYERAGLEMRSGYDLATARRSLNLLMMEWANKGINLWTVDSGTVSLTADTATYSLPTDTVDLIEYLIRTGSGSTQTDYAISRISVSTYANIPNKNANGRPNEVYVDRQAVTPTITVWPVPSDATYTFFYYRLRRMEDAGSPATNTMDVPFRFVPALIAGLAFHLAMKNPEALQRAAPLKLIYDEQFQLAADEDRERASWRPTPWVANV